MKSLLHVLQNLPEYHTLCTMVQKNAAVGNSGVSQFCRSHIIAALLSDSQKPAILAVQDELSAQSLQEELFSLTGVRYPILPTRELTLYDTAAVSRGWEHKRLKLLYRILRGEEMVMIAPLNALCQRTIPKEKLLSSAIALSLGDRVDLEKMLTRLDTAGYTRTSLVEGPGQFALRGGILDVYSPGEDAPVRVELFGDEIDAMGRFDTQTQRRTENLDRCVLLPAAECLSGLHEGGKEGLLQDLQHLIARQLRRKNPNSALVDTLRKDVDKLENNLPFTATDRYFSLIYPEFSCAADYMPNGSMLLFCDHSACIGRGKFGLRTG